jgi:hypothetical protein
MLPARVPAAGARVLVGVVAQPGDGACGRERVPLRRGAGAVRELAGRHRHVHSDAPFAGERDERSGLRQEVLTYRTRVTGAGVLWGQICAVEGSMARIPCSAEPHNGAQDGELLVLFCSLAIPRGRRESHR